MLELFVCLSANASTTPNKEKVVNAQLGTFDIEIIKDSATLYALGRLGLAEVSGKNNPGGLRCYARYCNSLNK